MNTPAVVTRLDFEDLELIKSALEKAFPGTKLAFFLGNDGKGVVHKIRLTGHLTDPDVKVTVHEVSIS